MPHFQLSQCAQERNPGWAQPLHSSYSRIISSRRKVAAWMWAVSSVIPSSSWRMCSRRWFALAVQVLRGLGEGLSAAVEQRNPERR